MRAVVVAKPGGPEQMQVEQVPRPTAGSHEVLVRVAAAGVNRADLLQRQGLYPPQPGASEVMGLECSGTVVSAPADCPWTVGDQVCALLAGGGYAELVAVPVGQVMPLPGGVDPVGAAGLPEAACTVYSNLAMVAGLRPGEWLLVHGGGSGIGTLAVQWAKAVGARVAVTAGSAQKLSACAELGADVGINYREQDFVAQVRHATDGAGADVILDVVGAKYLQRNVDALAAGGRLVVIGLQGGARGELDLGRLLARRASITATSLRGRPEEQKAEICRRVVAEVWPLVAAGRIRPVIHQVVPLADAATAHEELAASRHFGKFVLQVA
jgi:putative PIG3 family NAD(P)H quinone oxidoreductase